MNTGTPGCVPITCTLSDPGLDHMYTLTEHVSPSSITVPSPCSSIQLAGNDTSYPPTGQVKSTEILTHSPPSFSPHIQSLGNPSWVSSVSCESVHISPSLLLPWWKPSPFLIWVFATDLNCFLIPVLASASFTMHIAARRSSKAQIWLCHSNEHISLFPYTYLWIKFQVS